MHCLQVIAAVGQEHKLGRWDVCKEARNGLHILSLAGDEGENEDEENEEDEDS